MNGSSQKCPFCASPTASETLGVREMYKGTRDIFHFALCSDCGSVYILDFPDDISRYYDGYYSFCDDALTLEKTLWKSALVKSYSLLVVRLGLSIVSRQLFRCPSPGQMKILAPNLQAFLFTGAGPKDRILDVGSGGGQFVRMLRKFGYGNAIGIDPFVTEGSERPYVRRSDIESVSGEFDVILFNHSFEHLSNPETAVQKCADLLASDGTVVVHVPNVASTEFAKFKQNWWGLHAPYHFAIPSHRGLEVMAQRSGFKLADAICTSRYDHYLYSEDYLRDIPDCDARSVRRELESGKFEKGRSLSLSQMAYSKNKALIGDWIAYYLVRNSASASNANS